MTTLYCTPLVEICISAEAWAGWAQAFGTVAALLFTGWAVRRTHRLQLVADRKRESRQMAAEVESLEMMLGEILVRLIAVQSAAVDLDALSAHLKNPDIAFQQTEIAQALDVCRESNAIRPHLLLQFMRAYNAATLVRSKIAEVTALVSIDASVSMDKLRAAVALAVGDLEAVVRDLRASREGFEQLASQQS